ncbi:MAG: preQ(1) synthase [Candidatus Omnitrophica bacterium]|nr:preQ(1) synthase [Candidatus Omnitrophota bacterium]
MIYEDRKVTLPEIKAKKTQGKTFLPEDIDIDILKSIDYTGKRILIELVTDEFTCLCPFSGLPDFARITIRYIPYNKIVELKSLKYYFYAFRNVKIYNENVVNKILEDLKKLLSPYYLSVEADFTTRGGIKNKVHLYYRKKGVK